MFHCSSPLKKLSHSPCRRNYKITLHIILQLLYHMLAKRFQTNRSPLKRQCIYIIHLIRLTMSACGWSCLSFLRRRGASGAAGASLKQEGVTDVADTHWSGVRRQRQLVTGAAVAVNVSAVPTVVLKGRHKNGVRCATTKQTQMRIRTQTGKLTFLREIENSFWHCLHCVASSSFSQA